jgi:hypothetical protein
VILLGWSETSGYQLSEIVLRDCSRANGLWSQRIESPIRLKNERMWGMAIMLLKDEEMIIIWVY